MNYNFFFENHILESFEIYKNGQYPSRLEYDNLLKNQERCIEWIKELSFPDVFSEEDYYNYLTLRKIWKLLEGYSSKTSDTDEQTSNLLEIDRKIVYQPRKKVMSYVNQHYESIFHSNMQKYGVEQGTIFFLAENKKDCSFLLIKYLLEHRWYYFEEGLKKWINSWCNNAIIGNVVDVLISSEIYGKFQKKENQVLKRNLTPLVSIFSYIHESIDDTTTQKINNYFTQLINQMEQEKPLQLLRIYNLERISVLAEKIKEIKHPFYQRFLKIMDNLNEAIKVYLDFNGTQTIMDIQINLEVDDVKKITHIYNDNQWTSYLDIEYSLDDSELIDRVSSNVQTNNNFSCSSQLYLQCIEIPGVLQIHQNLNSVLEYFVTSSKRLDERFSLNCFENSFNFLVTMIRSNINEPIQSCNLYGIEMFSCGIIEKILSELNFYMQKVTNQVKFEKKTQLGDLIQESQIGIVFSEKHLSSLAFFLIGNTDNSRKKVGTQYRNRLAHLDNYTELLSLPKVYFLLWLVLDVLNSTMDYFEKTSS